MSTIYSQQTCTQIIVIDIFNKNKKWEMDLGKFIDQPCKTQSVTLEQCTFELDANGEVTEDSLNSVLKKVQKRGKLECMFYERTIQTFSNKETVSRTTTYIPTCDYIHKSSKKITMSWCWMYKSSFG